MIDTSHNATYDKFIAGSTGIGQSFALSSTAVKVLHVSVDSLTTTNHTTSGTSITINDTVTAGDVVTIVYLNNTTCVSTGSENQRLVLSGQDLSITEADGTTILNTVTLPSGGGSFNITDDFAQTNPVASGDTLEVVGRPGNPVVKTYFSDPLKLEVRLE